MNKEIDYKPLYGLSSSGKTKVWSVKVIENADGTAIIIQEFGQLGGKLQTNQKNVRLGKNLGKTNSTTPYEQACLEAESKFKKKIEQNGYSVDKDDLSIPEFPMLAQTFSKAKHNIIYDCYVQPKLNGIRCTAKKINEDTIIYRSRKGLQYTTLEHITPTLLELLAIDEAFDGEIFNKSMSLQQIGAAVKRQRDDSLKLEFWIYDIPDNTLDFENRYNKYYSAIEVKSYDAISSPVKAVESVIVHNEEEIHNAHDEYVSQFFEGIIIRNKKGFYDFKHRSKNLIKLKNFLDEEFLVVSGYTGEGTSFEGQATLTCITKDNKEFSVVPKGNKAYREKIWQDLDKIVAAKTMLTVRFLEYSDSGIPIGNTVGICLRDYE